MQAVQTILIALVAVIFLFAAGFCGLGYLMQSSADHQAEVAATVTAELQADAFIRLMDHCEANPGQC